MKNILMSLAIAASALLSSSALADDTSSETELMSLMPEKDDGVYDTQGRTCYCAGWECIYEPMKLCWCINWVCYDIPILPKPT